MLRKLTVKNEIFCLTGKKPTISCNSMIQSKSGGLDVFTMTCLGYIHSAGRLNTHPNARLSALGFPTNMYMYLCVELRKSL